MLSTCFSDLEASWYSDSDVVTSFISIPQPDVASASAVAQLKSYVESTNATECTGTAARRAFDTGRFCKLRQGIQWDALKNVNRRRRVPDELAVLEIPRGACRCAPGVAGGRGSRSR